jgi:hypothetical protein
VAGPAAIRWSIAAGVFAASLLLRFLSPQFHNEHFTFLSGARQILAYGELPFRDFIDPGHFLVYYVSAAALILSGHTLLGDALLSTSLLAAATSITFLLASHASRSNAIGLLMAVFFFASYPRLYNYYKLLFLVAGLWLCWAYIDKPVRRRLAALALGTVLALMVRPDLAVYLGSAALVTLVAVHWTTDFRLFWRRGMLFSAIAACALLPFWTVLQIQGGVARYYGDALAFGEREKSTQRPILRPFQIDLSQPLIQTDPPPPPEPQRINVRWREGTDEGTRARLERRYGLGSPIFMTDDPRQRTWRYEVLDTSSENLQKLVREARVDDLSGLDRSTGELPPPRETPPPVTRVAPGLFRLVNANLWLYYTFLLLPAICLVVLVLRRGWRRPRCELMPGEVPKVLAAVTLCAVADRILVTLPTHGRLSDVGAPMAVLGAWLLGQLASRPCRQDRSVEGPGQQDPRHLSKPERRATVLNRFSALSGYAAVGLILAVTWLSITTSSEAGLLLEKTDLRTVVTRPLDVGEKLARTIGRLTTQPPIDDWAPPDSTALRAATRYVRACTQPGDRILLTWFDPRVAFYSQRAFAGGVIFFHHDHFSSPEEQERIIAKLETQSVPIVITDAQLHESRVKHLQPLIYTYLAAHYRRAHQSGLGERDGDQFRILVDRSRTPTSTYGEFSLPCYA